MDRGRAFAATLIAAMLAGTSAPALADARLKRLAYDPEAVVQIDGKLGVQATIAFGEGETIENVAVGDSAAWQITPNKRANLLFVKPLEAAARTNMTVVTDRHTYFFDLVASAKADALYMLRFTYEEEPVEEPVVLAAAESEPVTGPVAEEVALAEADEAIVEEPAGEPDALAATEPEVEEPEALAESADPVEAEAPQLAATEVISEPVVQPLAEAEEPDAPQLAAAEVISEPVVQPVPEAADSAELAENEAEPAPAEPEEPELAEAPEEISEPQVAAREVVSEPVVQDIALADEKPEAEPELAEADDEQQRAEADEASPVDDEKQTELASAAEADPVSEDDEPAEGGEERVAEGDTEEAAPEVGETDNALAASEDAPVPDEADDEFALAFGDEFDLARLDSSEGQDGASERAAALNFAWSRTGDSALLPRRIYDDGASTYIVWDAAQAVPTILIRDAAGEEGEATYDLRGQTVVIGQVPALIVLRNENASATLENLRGPAGEAAETASEEPAQASLDAETEPDERL